MKVFMIAGEPSGDRLGASLMRALRAEHEEPIEFVGVGGAAMAAEGMRSLFPIEEIAIIGIAEVLPKLRSLIARINQTAQALLNAEPDAVVTIDAPGFGLRVTDKARPKAKPETTFVHYVAPSVWAWRPGRAQKMAKHTDHLLALLPFEPPYFHEVGLSCDFVGHPIVEAASGVQAGDRSLRAELEIPQDAPVVVTMPGSRRSEVGHLAPIFRDVLGATQLRLGRRLTALVPAAENVAQLVSDLVTEWPIETRILDPRGMSFAAAERRKFRAMAAADAALAASGTVSVELAAMRTPMVAAYKTNWLTAQMVRRLVKIDTASLVNLAADMRVMPEFFQENCTMENLASALTPLLQQNNAKRAPQLEAYDKAMKALGEGYIPPSRRAAQSVLRAIRRKRKEAEEDGARRPDVTITRKF